MREQVLKVKDIHTMYKKVYISANEVVKDARLLFENGSFDRAYYLAQTALEEFSKLNILYAFALRVHNNILVTVEDVIVKMKGRNLDDDDLAYGIVLLIEKNFINYPPVIDSLLHQPRLNINLNISHLEEQLSSDDLVINVLETYKELSSLGILNKRELSRELFQHVNSYKKHSLQSSFYNEQLVMPFEVITEELCTARLITVLVLQRIFEISGYQRKDFELFKFDEKYYNRIEERLFNND